MIVLASKSASRQEMLSAAGVIFQARPAAVDERALEAAMGSGEPADIALALARAKALAVPAQTTLVLGSDSLVVVDGRRFDKPASQDDAAAHLRFFSGRTIELHSAAALALDGEICWDYGAIARLRVRPLSDNFIDAYVALEWPAISHCVGVFRIEGPGVQLFDRIDGDHFTVLGMPLLAVLGALRELGELST